MASGGYRQPASPAAVSGPGALSRRTDGGAGSKTQPLRVPTGGKYGEAKALREQEQAAPMAAGGPATPSPQPVPQSPQGAAAAGAFGPTGMPNEPNTQMPPSQPGMASDTDAVLRYMYSLYPSPYISRLIGTMPKKPTPQPGFPQPEGPQ